MKFHFKIPHDTAAIKKSLCALLLMASAYLTGNLTGRAVGHFKNGSSPATSYDISGGTLKSVSCAGDGWGLCYGKEGEQPEGNASAKELRKYDAYYVGSPDEKNIFLTFDAGYDNGNLIPILDALKKHDAPATFFVVGTFVKSNPELVNRILKDGHAVGNHTYRHLDMSKFTDIADFQKELKDTEDIFFEATGKDIDRYYRPPMGRYSAPNLKMAKKLGYKTILWSLAYVDWITENQPAKDDALKKLTARIHPGAIVLLHSTSKTNAKILDELLTKWEDMGYDFKPLSEI